ncbi:polysaccharide deacetylase family protein [Clostridiaceae bacterium M8S5]|nr:polysaccharide deacetylase family protein [Clostridiaceae bacterium M8S5]
MIKKFRYLKITLVIVIILLSVTVSYVSSDNNLNSINQIPDVGSSNPNFYQIHYVIHHNIMHLNESGLFNPNKHISVAELLDTFSILINNNPNSINYNKLCSTYNLIKNISKQDNKPFKIYDSYLPDIFFKVKDQEIMNKQLTMGAFAGYIYNFLNNENLLTKTKLEILPIDNSNLVATKNFVHTLLGTYSDNHDPITKIELANILESSISITYDNYEYYRCHIKDTANHNALKCYSEGIMNITEDGHFKPNKIMTQGEVITIIDKISNPTALTRPNYEYIKNIPILMYHEINTLPYKGPTSLYVSRENFSKQLDLLKDYNYNTISMSQLYNHWENNYPLPKNPIVLTFDDGYPSHFNYAANELSKRGMCGTFYLITSTLLNDTPRSPDHVRKIFYDGMEIGSHTVTHVDFHYNSNAKISKEIAQSKKILEKMIDSKITHFCYPAGHSTVYGINEVKKHGYLTAVKTTYGISKKSDDFLTLKRLRINYYDTANYFLKRLGVNVAYNASHQ